MKHDSCMRLGLKHFLSSDCLIVAVNSIAGRDSHLKMWHFAEADWLTAGLFCVLGFLRTAESKKKHKKKQLLWPLKLIVYIQRLLFAFIYHSLFNFKMYFLWISNCLDVCTRHREADVAAGNSNMVEALRLAEVWAAVTCCSCTLRKWGLKHSVPEQESINKSICTRLLKYAQTLTVYSNGPGGLFVFTSSKASSWRECRCYFFFYLCPRWRFCHFFLLCRLKPSSAHTPAVMSQTVQGNNRRDQSPSLVSAAGCSCLRFHTHTEEIWIYWWCNSLLKREGR